MTQTDYLIAGIRKLIQRDACPAEVHQIKRCMLDWVGVSFAGASLMQARLEPFIKIAAPGPCSSFVTERKVDVFSASFLNGYVSHVMELDDGHRYGMLHLESPIFSALWSVAQQENIDFEHFVKGILVGYQTTIRLARCIQPEHKIRGYHATGTCGTIGVACAIAVALGLTDKELESAIGSASTRAAGLLSALDAPSEIKPFNVASAVEGGIRSAYMARCGVSVQDDPIDGKRGFFKMYAPKERTEFLQSFADNSEILNIYYKPYASCRHCHAPAECALLLKQRYRLEKKDIQEVLVETYRLAIDGHSHTEIPSSSSAKMSIPYCVAAALYMGSCGMDAFTEQKVRNDDILSLTREVRVEEDQKMTSLSPGKRGARVTVLTKLGQSFSVEVENPLGEPEHPMSDDMLAQKYFDLMRFAQVEDSKAKSIHDMIWNFESKFKELQSII